jgi:hypothetical protein
LDIPELVVNPLLLKEVFMFALLCDFALLHHVDAIGIADSRWAIAALAQFTVKTASSF